MSGPAQVRSVVALERFRASLVEYEKRTQTALDILTAELRRATTWVEEDRPHYWLQQEKNAADAVHQAKLDVERCLIFTTIGDQQPACREERAALQEAKDRLAYCQDKRQQMRHWQGILQHEVFEFKGRLSQLRRILETELPAARAKLQLIIRQVEGYEIERPLESRETPVAAKPQAEN
jgi:hypothetical protein